MIKTLSALLKIVQGPALEQIEAIHLGFSREIFVKLADLLDVSVEFLGKQLVINPRTLRSRKQLNAIESEKSMRLARVYSQACRVLGDDAQAKRWLVSPITSLNDRQPISFLETDVGAAEVTNVLNAIDWGVYL